MWLTGTPSSTIFAEPLLHKDQIFTINKGKTNVFMKEHATVNRLCFNKQRKRTHPAAEIHAKIESCCVALRKDEPDEAVFQMRTKGAPGPDDIPPTLLKTLGPRARQGLVGIFYHSV